MEISNELLISAAHSMFHGNAAQQHEGAAFFLTWQNSSDALITSTEILFQSLLSPQSVTQDQSLINYLRYLICCVILSASSSESWFKYDRTFLDKIKNDFLTIQFTNSFPKNISEKLDQIIANFALNELPEQWPDFFPIISKFLESSVESKEYSHLLNIFRIFYFFLNFTAKSSKLSLKRRLLLHHFFIQSLEPIQHLLFNKDIFQVSNPLETDFSLAKSFLSFAGECCNIHLEDSSFHLFLSNFIFDTFISYSISTIQLFFQLSTEISEPHSKLSEFEDLLKTSFESLTCYLSKRIIMVNYIPNLVQIYQMVFPNAFSSSDDCLIPFPSLNTTKLPLNNFSSSLFDFLCNYLRSIFNFGLNEELISNQENLAQIQTLLNITLIFAPRSEFKEPFWKLWNGILTDSQHNEIVTHIYLPLLPHSLETFFDLLPCSSHLSRLCSPLIAATFQHLIEIAPDVVVSFLAQQPVGLSLCFALGILKHQLLLPKLIETLQCIESLITSETPDLGAISGVLYALSRNSALIMQKPGNTNIVNETPNIQLTVEQIDLFIDMFKKLSLTLLSCKNSEFQRSLLYSLNHMASNTPESLTRDLELIDILLGIASNSSELESEDFLRLCRILSKVIMTTPQQVRDEYIEKLTSIASIRLDSQNIEAIYEGTHAAYSISSIPIVGSQYITQKLWKPLINAMRISRNLLDFNCFSEIVSVFASSIRTAPFSWCRKYIEDFIQIATETPQTEDTDWINISIALLDAYNQMCQMYHDALDDYRDFFASHFAHPMIQSPTTCFFEFFTIAGLRENEEEIVVQIACESLQNPDVKISCAAADLLRRLMSRTKNPEFLVRWQPFIIKYAFLALFDELHNDSKVLVRIIRVVYSIYKNHLRKQTLTPLIDQTVVESISDSVGDADVSLHIAESMRAVANEKEKFIHLLKEFLVTYARLNPFEMKNFDESLNCHFSSIISEAESMNRPLEILNEDEYEKYV